MGSTPFSLCNWAHSGLLRLFSGQGHNLLHLGTITERDRVSASGKSLQETEPNSGKKTAYLCDRLQMDLSCTHSPSNTQGPRSPKRDKGMDPLQLPRRLHYYCQYGTSL